MDVSVAGSPTCLAGLRHAVRTSLQQLPDATISADVVDDLVLAVSEAATNAILYGSCTIQPLKVPSRYQVAGWRRRSATGRPASRTAPLTSACGRGLWLIGRLVDESCLAKTRPGTLVLL
jgi:two-component sensor histidine kinase